jgi:hypothetical protein
MMMSASMLLLLNKFPASPWLALLRWNKCVLLFSAVVFVSTCVKLLPS